MKTQTQLLMVAVAMACLVGCEGSMEPAVGTSRHLGAVSYDQAFNIARQVMGTYYQIDQTDPARGVITSRPKAVKTQSERLVTRMAGMPGSPARQIATLEIRRRGDLIHARAVVEVQQQETEIHRYRAADEENYDGVPNKTPADVDAAATPEQKDLWRTVRYDSALEHEILRAIQDKLHPGQAKAAVEPASQPAPKSLKPNK